MMWPMKSDQPMAGVDPARMADLIRRDLVRHVQQRNRIRVLKPRQVEIPKEHDVRIEDAKSLVGQRYGRSDLEILLHMPAADRLGSKRPPILPPLALDDAGERAQPFGQESRCGKHYPALAPEVSEQGQVAIRDQQIMLRK